MFLSIELVSIDLVYDRGPTLVKISNLKQANDI